MSEEVQVLTPREAYEICKADAKTLLIDVRSSMEYLFVGHPVGAIHIPWIDEPEWVINPNFVADVRKLLLGGQSGVGGSHDVHIILICRSGKRSKEAGKVLLDAGLRNVYNIEQGFEGELDSDHHRSTLDGWRFHGLPWEQC